MQKYTAYYDDEDWNKFKEWVEREYEQINIAVIKQGMRRQEKKRMNIVTFTINLSIKQTINLIYEFSQATSQGKLMYETLDKEKKFKGERYDVKKIIDKNLLKEFKNVSISDIEQRIQQLINSPDISILSDKYRTEYQKIISLRNFTQLLMKEIRNGSPLSSIVTMQRIFNPKLPHPLQRGHPFTYKINNNQIDLLSRDEIDQKYKSMSQEIGRGVEIHHIDSDIISLPLYKKPELDVYFGLKPQIFTIPFNYNLTKKCVSPIYSSVIKIEIVGVEAETEDEPISEKIRNNILPCLTNIRRGDIIYFQKFGAYRNDGVYMYDGKKIVDLNYDIDDYGSVSQEFLAIDEFPLDYFVDVIDHNQIINIDVNEYTDQLQKNLSEDMFIDDMYRVTSFIGRDQKLYKVYVLLEDKDDPINWKFGYYRVAINGDLLEGSAVETEDVIEFVNRISESEV